MREKVVFPSYSSAIFPSPPMTLVSKIDPGLGGRCDSEISTLCKTSMLPKAYSLSDLICLMVLFVQRTVEGFFVVVVLFCFVK